MTIELDNAITRLAAAHRRQEELAAKPTSEVGPELLSGACEDRDAILAEVIRLGQAHLAQFAERRTRTVRVHVERSAPESRTVRVVRAK